MVSILNKEKKPLLITNTQILRFQKKILSFYKTQGRTLPWRQTTDPYRILLSETMLQQTQVSRVITYYTRWIELWPTLQAFAQASRKEVLKAWMGLGYNSRAVNLHRTVQIIVTKFQGDTLVAMKHFEELPGIGIYTSRAVQIFSANTDIVTVDTNIRRILIHEFHLPENISQKELWNIADRCLPHGKSRDWHNALMDYGALVLTSKKTGISPQTKQSRFEGSDRQIRAKIIRLLLEHPYDDRKLQQQINIEINRLQIILQKMVDQQLITKKNKKYRVLE